MYTCYMTRLYCIPNIGFLWSSMRLAESTYTAKRERKKEIEKKKEPHGYIGELKT